MKALSLDQRSILNQASAILSESIDSYHYPDDTDKAGWTALQAINRLLEIAEHEADCPTSIKIKDTDLPKKVQWVLRKKYVTVADLIAAGPEGLHGTNKFGLSRYRELAKYMNANFAQEWPMFDEAGMAQVSQWVAYARLKKTQRMAKGV